MAEQPEAGRDHRAAEVIELGSVPGFVVFDLVGAPVSAGGTRLAPDVTVAEVALLARAMTYKFAALGARTGGAKAGVLGDPADREATADLMARYCTEIRPLADSGRFLTGPDMGTSEEDFALLRERNAAPAAIRSVVDGVPFEDVVTGYGVAVAAEAALAAETPVAVEAALAPETALAAGTSLAAGRPGQGGGWAGRSVAIEGFGKVGGGVAVEVTRRGGRVVAVSTLAGCVADQGGLDVGRLLELRARHGDACVTSYGRPAAPPERLFTVPADVLVPGTRPGVISGRTVGSLPPQIRVIAPAANVPYTEAGAQALHRRGIVALPDFVCNAGAVIGYRAHPQATPGEVLTEVETTITRLIREAIAHPAGPIAGACARAQDFLRGWWGEPPGPPYAPETATRT